MLIIAALSVTFNDFVPRCAKMSQIALSEVCHFLPNLIILAQKMAKLCNVNVHLT